MILQPWFECQECWRVNTMAWWWIPDINESVCKVIFSRIQGATLFNKFEIIFSSLIISRFNESMNEFLLKSVT